MRVVIVFVLLMCASVSLSKTSAPLSALKTHKSNAGVTAKLDKLFRTYTWGFDLHPSRNFLQTYYRVLKFVASADGEFSDVEKGAFVFNARQLGSLDEDINAILEEDLSHFDVEGTVKELHKTYPSVGRWLIYDCNMIAGADGVATLETETIDHLAELFKLDHTITHGLRYGFEVYYKGKEMTSYYLGDEVRVFS